MEGTENQTKVEMVHDYPKQVYPDPPYRPPEYLVYLEQATNALRSVRIVVYAGMTAFVLLAAYGFFLIYLLTSDARIMSQQTMRMADQMGQMSRTMRSMDSTMSDMSSNVGDMRSTLLQMNQRMAAMETSIEQMTTTVALIQHSARNLDTSFGPAMGVMNRFMPFGATGSNYRGAPPFAPLPAPPRR